MLPTVKIIFLLMIGFITQSTMTAQDFLPHEKRLVSGHCWHLMIEAYKYASLVPRLPDLFNACEKRGGAWYAKSRKASSANKITSTNRKGR